MHYYKILKHKAGFDEGTNYWEKLLARYLAATGGGKIHTTLPIIFTSTSWKLVSWTIYGNNNVGKNIVDLRTISPKTAGNVTLTPDGNTGFVTCTTTNGQPASADITLPSIYLPSGISGNYYLSGCPGGGSSTITYDIYPWDQTAGARPYKWDGVTPALSSVDDTPQEVQFIAEHTYRIGVRVRRGQRVDGLVFKPMVRLPSTSADFEPYQVGVGERTKNLLEITANTQIISRVTFTVDKDAGTITANGTADSTVYLNLPIDAPSGDYYYSGCALGGSASTYDLYAWDNTISGRPKKWDGETNVDSDYGGTSREIKVDSEHSMQLTIRIRSGQTVNNLVFRPMLRAADTDAEFIPYGYEVPLTVSQTGQTDKSYDIYIGDSPLTEGQTASNTMEIEVFEGENTIDTTLYNKPEMEITYE